MRKRFSSSLVVMASFAVAVLVAAAGCGDSAATKEELHEAYARGNTAGRQEGEARAVASLHDEWEAGYEEGLSDGEDEARGTISELEGELEQEQGEERLGQIEAEEELEGEYGYEYGGHPTTEDFGEGNGYVVECEDGTLSDSGGIQGACSHHGGVR